MKAIILRTLLGEALGTMLLLAVVVGSGQMGDTLAQGNTAVALLANSTATGLALWWLIVLFAPISGAHFNPLVSCALAWRGELPWHDALARTLVQTAGALAGVALAHAMFDLPLLAASTHARTSGGLWLSEVVATCGLLMTILLGRRAAPGALPALIGAYIAAAYWFTASTSFANPAVTLARAFTSTFAGIRLSDVPAFVIAQCAGAVLALLLERLLLGTSAREAA
jgi:glycerol uptake facilitator-like aquaporin